jgi:DNA repair protein RecN (Recombination protein N)
MLAELRIRNFALVDDLSIAFHEGLNVITGETGAGKSIILQALALLCGNRGDTEMIRGGESTTSIEGLFDVTITEELAEAIGLDHGDDLLIRRVLSRSGRGRIHINHSPVSASLLDRLGDSLVHIYGQHDQSLLLRPAYHLDLLDQFGRLKDLRKRIKNEYSAWRTSHMRVTQLEKEQTEALQLRAMLESEIEELEAARIGQSEENELREERAILRHAEKLHQAASEAEETLYSSESAIVSRLARLGGRLRELSSIDQSLAASAELIESARVQLEEASHDLGSYAQRVHHNAARLEQLEDRLALLSLLSRKYGVPASLLPRALVERRDKLGRLVGNDEVLERERRERAHREAEALATAAELSKARRLSGARLEKRMSEELSQLGMTHARFSVQQTSPPPEQLSERLTPLGYDTLEFRLSANRGEEPKALAKIASGGELSRIMLALKALTATHRETPILLFDEVDAGIGGSVADAVARRLHILSRTSQILCITHLPQIAAYADHHVAVEKHHDRGRTVTRAQPLDAEERIRELSRMLGGAVAPAEAEQYARRLMEQARNTFIGAAEAKKSLAANAPKIP